MAKLSPKTRLKRFKKWVKALRSGEYKQCFRTLFRTNEDGISYCVLGVGATCAGLVMDYDTISKYYGLTGKSKDRLWNLNDNKYKTFNELADFIEKQYVKRLTKATS